MQWSLQCCDINKLSEYHDMEATMSKAILNQWREIALASVCLPDDKILKILEVVEGAPQCDHTQELLTKIRPRLVLLKPSRKITPLRLLCMPADDLFRSADSSNFTNCALPRTVIRVCEKIVAARNKSLITLTSERLSMIDHHDRNSLVEIGCHLWDAGHDTIMEFVLLAEGNSKFRATDIITKAELSLLRHARAFAGVLKVANEIELIKTRLINLPIVTLSRGDTTFIKNTMCTVAKRSYGQLMSLTSALIARVSCPGSILDIIVSLVPDITEEQAILLQRHLSGDVLSELSRDADCKSANMSSHNNNLMGNVVEVEILIQRLTSIEKSIGVLGRHHSNDKISETKANISNIIISHLTPTATKSLCDDLKALVGCDDNNDRLEDRLEDCADSINRCIKMSDTLGIRSDLEAQIARVMPQFSSISHDMSQRGRSDIRRLVMLSHLVELIAGPEQAQRLLDENKIVR